MTKEQTKAAAEVMMAWADGKEVEWKNGNRNSWQRFTMIHAWDWCNCEYRIKPEPREFWISPNGSGVCDTARFKHPGPDWFKVREVIE